MSLSTLTIAPSLDESLDHAISFLTNPLRGNVPQLQLNVLTQALRHNLVARFSRHWNPSMPKAGSGTRCLSFSPMCDPPKPILQACQVAHVQWASWIQLLGAQDFDLVVDPGCVYVRSCGTSQETFVIWEATTTSAPARLPTTRELISNDDDSDLFRLIDSAVSAQPVVAAPRWLHVTSSTIPTPRSSHSRSSSSSGFSEDSNSTCPTSIDSASGMSPPIAKFTLPAPPTIVTPSPKPRTNPLPAPTKSARIYVDATKKAVTNYDGGKTGVLTGGTMLGSASRR